MLFVRDKGRMCNNILQYGHVYAWGREHHRQTMSMRFAYKYPWFHICETRYHHYLTYVFAKYGAKFGLIPVVNFDEDGKDYSHEEQLMLDSRMLVVGGWYARWYDLFLKYKPEILQLFSFKEKVKCKVAELLGTEKSLRLGVHIRRGDYASFMDGKFFYSDEQYVHIIQQFQSLHQGESLIVYICGNDPQIEKDYYHRNLPMCEVVFPNGNPAEDLCLLSHCDYIIGAPSTFSLVATMYHDSPLYWIENPEVKLTLESFKHFDDLFRHIY